jgi:hypothetical protein
MVYGHLLSEESTEKFDQRRVYLLKSRNIQLERQLLMQADALESRAVAVAQVTVSTGC